jgi:hypothetical protein
MWHGEFVGDSGCSFTAITRGASWGAQDDSVTSKSRSFGSAVERFAQDDKSFGEDSLGMTGQFVSEL